MITLPAAAKKALKEIAKASADDKSDIASEALAAVGYPSEGRMPLARELTDAQRAVATALAPMRDVWLGEWRIPQPSWARLRWLGLAPLGVIDQPVKAPLWQKLHAAGKGSKEQIKAFAKLDLPLLNRLDVYGDIVLGGYRLFAVWSKFGEIRGEAVGAWAKTFADRAGAAMASEANDQVVHLMRSAWLVATLGLVRAKIPFEEKWASFVNPSDGSQRLVIEALKGIHEPLRSTILAKHVTKNVYSGAAAEGRELLTHFPSAALENAIKSKSKKSKT